MLFNSNATFSWAICDFLTQIVARPAVFSLVYATKSESMFILGVISSFLLQRSLLSGLLLREVTLSFVFCDFCSVLFCAALFNEFLIYSILIIVGLLFILFLVIVEVAEDVCERFREYIITFISQVVDNCFMLRANIAYHLMEAFGSITPLFRILLSTAAPNAHHRAFE
jgi:hypothetical protein